MMNRNGNEAVEISVDELRELLSSDEPVTVLDVRDSSDRAEWSIPGSMHVDAYEALKDGNAGALADLNIPSGVPVVTVCNAGATSKVAMQLLRNQGIHARSLAGGMKAWSLAWNSAELAIPHSSTAIVQVRRTGKGCLSYIIGNGGEAAVIDAALDPGIYVDLARDRGWTIARVVDTHIHADHLSSSRDLAEKTGAVLHLPMQHRASFPFTPLQDGDAFQVGGATVRAIATPGHTLESMVYMVDEFALFTGDTLFLSGVGRPDLEATAGEASVRARLLYHSLQKLTSLPLELMVFPGHTNEPIPFDRRPVAMPLGEVVARVGALKLAEDAFVAYLIERIPPAPPNHAQIVALNEAGAMPGTDRTDLEAGANRCAVN